MLKPFLFCLIGMIFNQLLAKLDFYHFSTNADRQMLAQVDQQQSIHF